MIAFSHLLFRQLFDRVSCTYTYLLADLKTKNAVLIDPVDRLIDRDLKLVYESGLTLGKVLNTHAHADHISASGLIKQKLNNVISVIGKASKAKADLLVSHGDKVPIGSGYALRVLETPGHTAGCVSYFLAGEEGGAGFVFTGDALFVRGCGRTDFQGGNSKMLFRSVRENLFSLPENTVVYPGHDYKGMTCSTIGEEIIYNPRLDQKKSLQDFQKIMKNLQLKYPSMMDTAVPANLNCGIPPS